MKWISVEEKKPKVGETVLCYYRIGGLELYCVGKLEEILSTRSSGYVHVTFFWRDTEGNSIEPEYWTPITLPKGKEKT